MTSLVLNRRNRFQLQQQLKHTRDAALYRRTLAILEIDQGKAPAVVAEELGVTRQSVYNWVEIYAQSYDPLSLVDEARSGRPSSWTPDFAELLTKLLKESPGQWGFQAVDWTVPLLRQQLASWDGRWLAEDTIRRRLHELGYVWKRTRYVLPADPEGEKKKSDSPKAQKPASAQCHLGRGRNRFAVVSTSACGMGIARTNETRADYRKERQARGVRHPEHQDRQAPVVGSAAASRY
jgi:transposase